jgi:hypothetical protein
MGLTDVTLGWYEDANGVVVSDSGRAALSIYLSTLSTLTGAAKPRANAIRGWTFSPAAVVANASALQEAIRIFVASLMET